MDTSTIVLKDGTTVEYGPSNKSGLKVRTKAGTEATLVGLVNGKKGSDNNAYILQDAEGAFLTSRAHFELLEAKPKKERKTKEAKEPKPKKERKTKEAKPEGASNASTAREIADPPGGMATGKRRPAGSKPKQEVTYAKPFSVKILRGPGYGWYDHSNHENPGEAVDAAWKYIRDGRRKGTEEVKVIDLRDPEAAAVIHLTVKEVKAEKEANDAEANAALKVEYVPEIASA